jgi:hypothetical protein
MFVPRPGQVDYTRIRYAPVLNAVVVCGGKVLLLQRSSGMRSYPNHWRGISGYLDDDRSVEDKARQEMLKEVGITAEWILTMQRGTVLLQEAPEHGKSWLVVQVRDRRYRLDLEWRAPGAMLSPDGTAAMRARPAASLAPTRVPGGRARGRPRSRLRRIRGRRSACLRRSHGSRPPDLPAARRAGGRRGRCSDVTLGGSLSDAQLPLQSQR